MAILLYLGFLYEEIKLLFCGSALQQTVVKKNTESSINVEKVRRILSRIFAKLAEEFSMKENENVITLY